MLQSFEEKKSSPLHKMTDREPLPGYTVHCFAKCIKVYGTIITCQYTHVCMYTHRCLCMLGLTQEGKTRIR